MPRKGNTQSRKLRPGRLRIVAGKWRSRLLRIADVQDLRPTSERIRETVFNWLRGSIGGARCLDLYAGTGALGFEALSRGAAHVDFVESSGVAAAALDAARRELEVENSRVHRRDAIDFLKASAGARYDIVFLDPPYSSDAIAKLCRLLAEKERLVAGGQVYFEQPKARQDIEFPPEWQITHDKTAGQVRFGLVQAKGVPHPKGERRAAK